MPDTLVVGIGEVACCSAPVRLATYGLGSCLCIVLYDMSRRWGAMAHTLLPEHPAGMAGEYTPKFTDVAIRIMTDELLESGCDKASLVAKLAGGAALFEGLYAEGVTGIGRRNIDAAHMALAAAGIPLISEDVGGNHGRSIIFDLESGRLAVHSLAVEDINI